MKLPTAQIELACAKPNHDVRPYTWNVYLTSAGWVASDDKILAFIPETETTKSEHGPVPVDAIKACRKDNRRAPLIYLNQTAGVIDGPQFPRPEPYPAAPSMMLDASIVPEKTGDCDIAIDCELLFRLQKALCETKYKGLRFWFAKNADGSIDPNGAVRVEPARDTTGRKGAVMPMRP